MISAIVLAAGQSKRMGQQKLLMAWGKNTVIGKVIGTLVEGGVNDLYVVIGGNTVELKEGLGAFDIEFVHNKDYENGEMLTSIQVGLERISEETDAALITLGDQPQIEVNVVREIVERYNSTQHKIIVPSYKMRRGHPWLVEKSYWKEIRFLYRPATLRDFLNNHLDDIDYLIVDSPTVIQDLDTPADYSHYKP